VVDGKGQSVYGDQWCLKLLEEYAEYQVLYRLRQYQKWLKRNAGKSHVVTNVASRGVGSTM